MRWNKDPDPSPPPPPTKEKKRNKNKNRQEVLHHLISRPVIPAANSSSPFFFLFYFIFYYLCASYLRTNDRFSHGLVSLSLSNNNNNNKTHVECSSSFFLSFFQWEANYGSSETVEPQSTLVALQSVSCLPGRHEMQCWCTSCVFHSPVLQPLSI